MGEVLSKYKGGEIIRAKGQGFGELIKSRAITPRHNDSKCLFGKIGIGENIGTKFTLLLPYLETRVV